MRHLAAFSLVLHRESARVENRSLSSVSIRRYVGANRFVHALSSIVNGISPRPFAWLIQRDLTGFAVIDSGVTTHSPRRDSEPCAHAQIPLAPGTPDTCNALDSDERQEPDDQAENHRLRMTRCDHPERDRADGCGCQRHTSPLREVFANRLASAVQVQHAADHDGHAKEQHGQHVPPRHELQVEPHSEKRKRQCGNHSPQGKDNPSKLKASLNRHGPQSYRESSVRTIPPHVEAAPDRKSTRLNSSHITISYAVFCLKKKKKKKKKKKHK